MTAQIEISDHEINRLYKDKEPVETLSADEMEFMDHAANEIKKRIGLIKQNIFEIGKILYEVKMMLGRNGKESFMNWVDKNFEFSHRTATNYMNVYKFCAATPEIANMFNTSVLYKISSPTFNKDLRNALIENAKGKYEIGNKELAVVQDWT